MSCTQPCRCHGGAALFVIDGRNKQLFKKLQTGLWEKQKVLQSVLAKLGNMEEDVD